MIITTGASISYKLPLAFLRLLLGATDFLGDGPIILDGMIPLLGILQQTYLLNKQVKELSVQKISKAILSSDVLNFIPKMPRPGLGLTLTLTGYSSGLM